MIPADGKHCSQSLKHLKEKLLSVVQKRSGFVLLNTEWNGYKLIANC